MQGIWRWGGTVVALNQNPTPMPLLCQGRTAIVTGAGAGLGRSYALALAQAGASVIVNDINQATAAQTVADIKAAGGQALPSHHDITDYTDAGRLAQTALKEFGSLDAIVNNAGICRDAMFVTLSPEDWDAVVAVHLKGHFCLASHAARHWRQQHKEGKPVAGRIINTSSGAGLLGSVGQSNYSAAKGGILSLTLVQAAELARYNVTANALAPQARTAMTEAVFAETMRPPADGSFDRYHPDNVAPLVVWLASESSASVTGQCFTLLGGQLSIADGWRQGPTKDKGARWQPEEIGQAVASLLSQSTPPDPVYGSS